jgi:alpha-glucosidase
MFLRIFLTLLFVINAAAFAQSGPASVSSPDGRLTITFQTVAKDQPAPEGGQLVYTVSFQGKPLILQSALGLDLQSQTLLGPSLHIVNATRSQTDETYRLVAGKTSSVRNRYNALRVELEEGGERGRKLVMEARAYDDGVAFRYVFPDQAPIRDFRLVQENTEFNIAKDAITYALYLDDYRTSYELEFHKIPASGISAKQLIGLPLLMEVPGVAWMAITEADMRDYAAMYLVRPAASWGAHLFQSKISPNVNEPEIAVSGSLPHHSAWRLMLVGTEPGRLIESNTIQSLNPPSAIQDTAWIRPGRAAWNWWSGSIGPDGKSAFTTENMKYYVDFAAKSGFEYMLVDSGWSPRNDITKMNGRVDIPELVKYGATKNVKIWIWTHWSALDRQLEEAFPLYEKWGVAGVKTDFLMRDDQAMINFYYRTAEKAAQHHLMMDYHGATKPTGMERTWPNVVGYEAVVGMEQSKATGRDTPDMHVMLPFTRMLPGLMDYTPGAFRNVTKAEFEPKNSNTTVMGTRAHQLAMYVVYDSPIQMVSDHPGAYEGQPAFQFIKDAPATWDETRVLNGDPGEYITRARRRGDQWFLGSMTNWTPRSLEVPLTFLGSGRYTAEIYADAPDADRVATNVAIQKQPVDRTTRLKMQLAPGGGYAVRFVPAKP